jgi:uncharacterized protein (DUF433 family)
MQLEDYFDFHTTPVEYIRIKGTRIDIDFVIELYHAKKTPEQIAERFHTLELVQVYAAVTYYLQNKDAMDAYLARRAKIAEANYQASLAQPPSDAVKRIRAIKAARAQADAEQPS